MKISRIGRASSVAVIAAMALAGCGSSSNSDSSGSPSAGGSNSSGASAGGASSSGGGASSGGGSAAATDCFSGAISASGSTAQQNAMDQATSGYGSKCSSAKVNYTGSSSGQGITDFVGKQTQFAGSDSALNKDKGEPEQAKKACGSEALDLPMVTGPIAIAYNLKGVDNLVLTKDLIAKIFSGKIKKWNDPAIAAVNKDAKLPDKSISVFFRQDKSGTTDNFTKYMHATDPTDWTQEHDKSWKGSVGQGKPKSAGVASAVKSTDGGITYVEWSYVMTNQLQMAKVDNGGGPVELTADSVSKGVESAKVAGTGKDLSLKLDYTTKTPGAYPILLVTYEIVCSKYSDAKAGKNVKAFLSYMASDEFQQTLNKVGSAPLPKSIQTKVQESVNSIS